MRAPAWASEAEPEIALGFLRELVRVLRTGLDFEALVDAASLPPPLSGICVDVGFDNRRPSMSFSFVTSLDALAVAEALELPDPTLQDDPLWTMMKLACRARYGHFELEPLVEKPAGSDGRDGTAATRADRVYGLVVKVPYR